VHVFIRVKNVYTNRRVTVALRFLGGLCAQTVGCTLTIIAAKIAPAQAMGDWDGIIDTEITEQDAHDPNVPRADNRVNEGIARKALSADGSQFIFTVALRPGGKWPGSDDFFVFSLPARGSQAQQKDVQIGDS
jgi:hypothetical protein